jgi:hypothetical protein
LPAFYDSHHRAVVDILRWDSRQPPIKYRRDIMEIKRALVNVPVLVPPASRPVLPVHCSWRRSA